MKCKLEFLFTSSEIKSERKRKSGGLSQPYGSKKRKVLEESSKAKGKMRAVEGEDEDDFGMEDEYQEEDPFLSDDEDDFGVEDEYREEDFFLSDDEDAALDENLSEDNGDYEW